MKIQAYKCDRCGTLYENGSKADFTLRDIHREPGTVAKEELDLCTDCQLALRSWFREGHKKE